MDLAINKEEYTEKHFLLAWPKSCTKVSSDSILTYSKTAILKKADFTQKIFEINELIKFKIKNENEKEKIDYALKLYREALQIADFATRFLLNWRAFEVLITPEVGKGLISEQTIKKIETLLLGDNLPPEEIQRAINRIKDIDKIPKASIRAAELSKFVDENIEDLKKLIGYFEKIRGKIMHSKYIEENLEKTWYDCEQLRLLLNQVIKSKIGWPRTKLERPVLVPGIQIFQMPLPNIKASWGFKNSYQFSGG